MHPLSYSVCHFWVYDESKKYFEDNIMCRFTAGFAAVCFFSFCPFIL